MYKENKFTCHKTTLGNAQKKVKMTASKVIKNSCLYRCIGIPNIETSCMEWKCMLGKHIVCHYKSNI